MTSNKDFVFGRHAGLDYLKTQNADKINKVFLQHGIQEDFANQVYALSKKKRLVVQSVPKNKLDRLVDGGNHQGLVLAISSFDYADLGKMLDKFDEDGKEIEPEQVTVSVYIDDKEYNAKPTKRDNEKYSTTIKTAGTVSIKVVVKDSKGNQLASDTKPVNLNNTTSVDF